MAPKKQMMSPFGLFMAKYKMLDNQVKSMSFDQQIHYCNDVYKMLSTEDKKAYSDLSSMAKSSGLTDQEVYGRLRRIALDINAYKDKNGTNGQMDADDEQWDDPPMPTTTSSKSSFNQINAGFNMSAKIVKQEEEESDDDDEDLFAFIRDVIDSTQELEKKTIVVICFNVFVHTIEGHYCPNEVGITRFSLKDGHQDSYSEIIKWQIPSGYYGKAKDFSETYHKIPIDINDNTLAVGDYKKLFHEIYDFMSGSGLTDGKNRKIVFCKAEDKSGISDRPQVKGCLKALEKAFLAEVGRSAKSLVKDFVVVELTDLLFLTGQRCCANRVMPRIMGIDTLNQTKFDYQADLRCDFHADNDNIYCALMVVKKSAYLFLDYIIATGLKEDLDIKPSDVHRPKAPEDNSYSYEPKFQGMDKPHRLPHRYRYYPSTVAVPVASSRASTSHDIRVPMSIPNFDDGQKKRIGIGRGMGSTHSLNQRR